MNINLTLIGQMIAFICFVMFCMKYVWPPIIGALEARKKQIADGLAAGDRGKHELELAAKRASETMLEAKLKAVEIIAQAEKRAIQVIEEAKNDAARAFIMRKRAEAWQQFLGNLQQQLGLAPAPAAEPAKDAPAAKPATGAATGTGSAPKPAAPAAKPK